MPFSLMYRGNEKAFAAFFMISTCLADQYIIVLSKGDDGRIPYSVLTVNLAVELAKFALCGLWCVCLDRRKPAEFIQVPILVSFAKILINDSTSITT